MMMRDRPDGVPTMIDTSAWLLFLQLTTGQIVVLDTPNQLECALALTEINEGRRGVSLTNGIRLPIARAIECKSVVSVLQAAQDTPLEQGL